MIVCSIALCSICAQDVMIPALDVEVTYEGRYAYVLLNNCDVGKILVARHMQRQSTSFIPICITL